MGGSGNGHSPTKVLIPILVMKTADRDSIVSETRKKSIKKLTNNGTLRYCPRCLVTN